MSLFDLFKKDPVDETHLCNVFAETFNKLINELSECTTLNNSRLDSEKTFIFIAAFVAGVYGSGRFVKNVNSNVLVRFLGLLTDDFSKKNNYGNKERKLFIETTNTISIQLMSLVNQFVSATFANEVGNDRTAISKKITELFRVNCLSTPSNIATDFIDIELNSIFLQLLLETPRKVSRIGIS